MLVELAERRPQPDADGSGGAPVPSPSSPSPPSSQPVAAEPDLEQGLEVEDDADEEAAQQQRLLPTAALTRLADAVGGPQSQAQAQAQRGSADLRCESKRELLQDLELYADEFALWDLGDLGEGDRSSRKCGSGRARLRRARDGVIAAARGVRASRPELWTADVAASLHKALSVAAAKLSGNENMLEDPGFSTFGLAFWALVCKKEWHC